MTEAKATESEAKRPVKLSDLSSELSQLAELATNAKRTFLGIALACGYSFLTLFTTTDAELLTNSGSSTLPVFEAQIPIVGFFVVIPLALTFGYFYFHMYLQGLWRCISRLPPRTQENTPIDDYVYPWMISSSLVRSFAAKGTLGRRPMWRVEKAATVVLCWWLVPITLAGFWLRYLMAHQWAVTSLHVVLLIVVVVGGIAFYRMAVKTLRRDPPGLPGWRHLDYRGPVIAGVLVGALLLVFSAGAIEGAPASHCEEPLPGCERRFAAGRLLDNVGFGTARLDDVEVSIRPATWSGKPELLEQELRPIKSPKLVKSDLRHGRANSAFLAAADMSGSNLSWIELKGASLQGSRLEDVALRGAFLEGALLQRSRLNRADLTGARLENVQLQHAALDFTVFDKACLVRANLGGAQGKNARFGEAELTQATLDGAKLQHANLEFAKLGFTSMKQVDFTYAKMHSADLRGADMAGAVLKNAVLVRANLSKADLRPALDSAAEGVQRPPCGVTYPEPHEADMIRAQLSDAKLTEAILPRVCLADAIGERVDFRRADLRDAHLERAELKFADFRGAKLKNAKFSGAELQGSKFNGAHLESASFIDAKMTLVEAVDADLSGADLSGARLLKADLSSARLERARFRNAKMQRVWMKLASARGADLTGADLSDAQLQGADFTDATFAGANLTRANLTGAKGLEPKRLSAACGVDARLPAAGFERFTLEPCPQG